MITVASRLAISPFLYGKDTFEVVNSQLVSFLGHHVIDESREDELLPLLLILTWLAFSGSDHLDVLREIIGSFISVECSF